MTKWEGNRKKQEVGDSIKLYKMEEEGEEESWSLL
jgi:hypothetical protein